jgi:hypothetical protein
MKNIVLVIVTLLLASVGYSQHVLEWSLGDVEIICGEPIKVSYPLMVSISEDDEDPALGTTTMRFIYGSEDLSNLSIQNIQNGYYESGLHESNPVLGDIFGFSNEEGIFVQFDIMDNANSDPLMLSTTPTHVLDIMFDIDDEAQYPLCIPIVFDNNPDGWGLGITEDDGYVPGSAGLGGSYFLSNEYSEVIPADDEVINLTWKKSPGNSGKIKPGKKVGKTSKKDCIKRNICQGNGHKYNLDNIQKGSLFSVYPVPFDQEVYVNYLLDYDTDVTLEIFDASGSAIRKIEDIKYFKGNNSQQRIDLTGISSQLLFVKLITNRESSVMKIVSLKF